MSASDLPHDMSVLTPSQIAQFFFDRPTEPRIDWWDLDGEGYGPENPGRYVSNLTQLFHSFADLAKPYQFQQVEQGVWGLISHCSFSVDWIFQEDQPEQAFEFLTASRPMFLEYLTNTEFEASVLRNRTISMSDFILNGNPATKSVDDTGVFHQQSVARRLHDTAVVCSD